MVPRLAVYGAVSTALAGAVVGSALSSRPNFFSAAVSIGRSSGSLMVLANFGLFVSVVVGIVFKIIFFGQLRAVEYEHLFEKLWLFLTESLLALTIFRDDFSAPFAFMYGLLLFLKCFHWITADRVDYMDQVPPPGPPYTFHLRIMTITALLLLLDVTLVTHSINSILTDGVSAMVLFASEFTILLASIMGTILRYSVGVVDIRRARGREDAPSWEAKSMWLFYVDLAVDFVKLLTYLTFFTVILLHYGLPLHILRDVYMTLRSFLSRCGDLIRYQQATRDMDALYPNATAEEMERLGDKTCIICREEMVVIEQPGAGPRQPGNRETQGPNETPKKLGCGHVFHFHCLRSWLERQQSCPTCRRNVLRNPRTTRQNARNPIIPPPPPPAPGGVPVPPHQRPDAMRAAFNEFFQLPAQIQRPDDAPPLPQSTAPMNGDAAASHLPSGSGSTTNGSNEPATTDDQRIQSGIWGGPITPGRFFPSPLGASRYSSPTPPLAVGPSTRRVATPIIPPHAAIARNGIASDHSTLTRPEQHNDDDDDHHAHSHAHGHHQDSTSHTAVSPSTSTSQEQERPTLSARGSVSGVTTPFSSNPPVIFSATSTSRALEIEAENDVTTLERRNGDENSARRAAAEAALRRLNQSSTSYLHPTPAGSFFTSTSTSTSSSSSSSTLPILPDLTPSAASVVNGISSSKGKEKANPQIPSPSQAPQGETRHQPFLTPLQIPHFSTDVTSVPWIPSFSSTSYRSTGPGIGNSITAEQTRNSLDERLKILRRLDGVCWDLVGEMSRLKSVWESEDGVGVGVDGDGVGGGGGHGDISHGEEMDEGEGSLEHLTEG